MTSSKIGIQSFHGDLKHAIECVYEAYGFELTEPSLNPESEEYAACSFQLNGRKIQHRVAKITPTKTGQFVAIWKRDIEGKTAPFDSSDNLGAIIITVRKGEELGQFIFPSAVLSQQGIVTSNGKEGKRGMRVYPPWDIVTNKQAEKTQAWQIKYFLRIGRGEAIEFGWLKQLFAKAS